MDIWKQAFGIADIVLEQSYVMWIVYISFFALALVVRKKINKTRLHTGSVMLGFSIPGMLVSATCVGIFCYVMGICLREGAKGEHKYLPDYPAVRAIQFSCQEWPLAFLVFSPVLFGILSLVAIICGIVILAKRAGKAAGIITLIYGIALGAFSVWDTMAVLHFLAD